MLDQREPEAEPEIKREQEDFPPTRLDDPNEVAEEEKRFGMAVPIMVALITLFFIVVIIVYAI
jgi:hypothetical protein